MNWSQLQFGVDIATSIAILASAVTFIVNQRIRARESKRRQLNESVRSVTVDEFQAVLGALSTHFIMEIVKPSMLLHTAAGDEVEDMEDLLLRKPTHVVEFQNSIAITGDAINHYIEMICAYNYQIYPLLDSIEGGAAQIDQIRNSLIRLVGAGSQIRRRHESMLKDVRAVCDLCHDQSAEAVGHDVQQKIVSIVMNPAYKNWVEFYFVPEGKEDAYRECLAKGSFETEQELLGKVVERFRAAVQEGPQRVQALVLMYADRSISAIRQECKEFLVTLAAINYWLIRRDDENETLPEIIERYRSPSVFDLESAIR